MTIQARPDGAVFADSAKSGEIAGFPDIARGWGITFDQTEGIPPMEWFNDLFQRQDKAIKYLLQQGIAEWSTNEDYPKDALIKHEGQFWQATQENKASTPQKDSVDWMTFADIDQAIKTYSTAPTTKQGNTIYVEPFGMMRWNSTHNLYQSTSNIFEIGDALTPREGKMYANGAKVAIADYQSLYTKVQDNGLLVDLADWEEGTAFFTVDGTDLKLPQLGGEFIRFWANGRNVDEDRKIFTSQLDAMQKMTGYLRPAPLYGMIAAQYKDDPNILNGVFKATDDPASQYTWAGTTTSKMLPIIFDNGLVARTAEENRPRNVAFPIWINP